MKTNLLAITSLSRVSLLSLASLASVVTGCGSSSPSATNDVPMAMSVASRDAAPTVTSAESDALRDGNNAFATDLYQTLRASPKLANENLFFSPYSISLALAMTYAGAGGQTASEMASALHFTLPNDRLHAAFDQLDLALTSRGQGQPAADAGEPFRLRVVNSLWGSPQTTFVPAFLDTLARNYGAGIRLTDFTKSEDARGTINRWVSQETNDKIHELLGEGTIQPATRLVLVNAIYFNAAWAAPFHSEFTKAAPFHAAGGDVTAQMMSNGGQLGYVEGAGYRAVDLPYEGHDLALAAILPDDMAAFEPTFDASRMKDILATMAPTTVHVGLPKFAIPGASFDLKDALEARGMKSAFSGDADFSGMASSEHLQITRVVHQAFVSVDEKGTEAAAATAVVEAGSAAPVKTIDVTLDKPFLFVIHDVKTGAVLFVGRVLKV